MEHQDIQDAARLKELLNSGLFDRVLEKVKGKLSGDLFKTEHKEFKRREDIYATHVAADLFRKEILSLINDYSIKVGK